jgi:hypothetical protein
MFHYGEILLKKYKILGLAINKKQTKININL